MRGKAITILHAVLSAVMIAAWVICLRTTDAFYSVYIFSALLSLAALLDNLKNSHAVRGLRALLLAACAALLSAAAMLANYELIQNGQREYLLAAGLGLSGWFVWFEILLCAASRMPFKQHDISRSPAEHEPRPFTVYLCFFAIIATIDLLYLFLCRYPGVLSPDSIWQMEQVLGVEPFSNHHPFWNTILIKAVIDLGLAVFGNINAAVALYSTALVLFVSSSFAYALTTLWQCRISKGWILFALLSYALIPYHIAYSITMWKDVVFGCAALLFLTALYRALRSIGRLSWVNELILCLSAAGIGLWRSNGWLALFASTVCFAFVLWKRRKKLLLLLAVVLIGTWLLNGPALDAMGVTQPDLVEALSIPEQQVARVIVEGRELTAEQDALLRHIADPDEIRTVYRPFISDPVKAHLRSVNPAYFDANRSAYLKLWIELGLRYPADYVRAWVDQTRGYWNGGYAYIIYVRTVQENDLGIEQIPQDNFFSRLITGYFSWFDGSTLTEPIRSIGLHVWFILILFFVNLIHRREESLLAVPPLMIVGTLLAATPVFSEFRYAYAIFTVFPFYLAVTAESVSDHKKEV